PRRVPAARTRCRLRDLERSPALAVHARGADVDRRHEVLRHRDGPSDARADRARACAAHPAHPREERRHRQPPRRRRYPMIAVHTNGSGGSPMNRHSTRAAHAALGDRMRAIAGAMLVAMAALGGVCPAAAQVPAPPQDRPIALTGATIHTITNGVIQNGTIVFENGVITAVGTNVAVPANAQRIDVTGRHIYPGLIDAYSAMGLQEIGAVDVTLDMNELGDFTPNVRAELAVNPESRHIGTARSNGVLVTLTTPSGGLVSGLSAALMLDGWTWESMTLKSGAALNVEWPDPRGPRRFPWMQQGGNDEDQPTYAEQVQTLRDIFATARAYRDAQASGRPHDTDSRWEAMVPVVNGE